MGLANRLRHQLTQRLQQGQGDPHFLIRTGYPLRTIAYGLMFVLAGLHQLEFGWSTPLLLVMAYNLASPHLIYYSSWYLHNNKQAAFIGMYLDAPVIGFACAAFAFSHPPLSLFTAIMSINLAITGGIRSLLIGWPLFFVGVALHYAYLGLSYQPQASVISSLLSVFFCIVYLAYIGLYNQRDTTSLFYLRQELATKNIELERLAKTLSKYLSPQLYHSLFDGQKVVEHQTSRKLLTVFFSDLEGFTQMTDTTDPELLTDTLNEYFTAMSDIALKHGGTIDKFIGDAVMVFYGDPHSGGDKQDALACVRMALEMRQVHQQLQSRWRAKGIHSPPNLRMGIHTGFCTVGNFGSQERLDYTIIGSTVNLASRLESLALSNQILLSYETYIRVNDTIDCRPLQPVSVKGIAQPVQTYEVIESQPDTYAASMDGLEVNVNLDMVDRQKALAKLQGLIEQLKDR